MKRTINGRNALRPTAPHPSPEHWARLREQVLAEQGNACACCPNDADSGYQLELHHRHYENWGQEKPEDVVILCSLCHEYITSRFRFTDEYKVETGPQPPPRPGLPPVEIRETAIATPTQRPERPGLPPAQEQVNEIKPDPNSPFRKRQRPF